MKKIIVSLLILAGAVAEANYSSTLTVSSNYIYRGLSFSTNGLPNASSGGPVIQGTIDYTHSSGFALGTFVGNSDTYNFDTRAVERDTETDFNASYTYKVSDDMNTGLYAFWYNYLYNPSNNCMEFNAFLTWQSLRLDVSHIPNFFGTETSNNYIKLSARQLLDEKIGVFAHIGSSSFQDDTKPEYKNYIDHRVGLYYVGQLFTVDIAYSNTDRKKLNDVPFNDKAMTLSATATF